MSRRAERRYGAAADSRCVPLDGARRDTRPVAELGGERLGRLGAAARVDGDGRTRLVQAARDAAPMLPLAPVTTATWRPARPAAV